MEPADISKLVSEAWMFNPVPAMICNREGVVVQINDATRTSFQLTRDTMPIMQQHYNIFKDESFIQGGVIPIIEQAFNGNKGLSEIIDYYQPDIYAQTTDRMQKAQILFLPLHVNRTVGEYIAGYFINVGEVVEAKTSLREREKELEYVAHQQRMLQAEIEARATPVVPILEGILVLPLVGAIDSYRAQDVLSSVLEAASQHNANSLILDITGVPVVDTAVANYILQAIRALKLLGTETILVGISPEIAQTVIQLGLKLDDITTRANLQSGLETALQRQGLKIVKA